MRLIMARRRQGHATAPLAIEIFSGCGRWAASMRSRGYDVIEVDRRHGFDLLKSTGRNLLLQFLRDGFVDAVHVATPCSSFSRARERGGGPTASRSDVFPSAPPAL